MGNRLGKTSLAGAQSYTYDENDRLLSDGKYTYGWDEAGNLTSRTGPEGTTVYRYDAENRLIEASGPEGTVSFTYDAAGNRIARTTAEGTTEFVVDPNMPYAQVLEEAGPGGEKVYAYGNDLLNVQGPEEIRWFAYDGLGSTRALTDQGGTLTDEYVYEAFGSMAYRTGTTGNEFLFTGEQWEPGFGMYYLRARYFSPNLGRFGVRDCWSGDVGSPLTLNSYIYCLNDPVNRIDPSGNFSLFELNTTTAIRSTLTRITSPFSLTMVKAQMLISAHYMLLTQIAFYSMLTWAASTIYVTLEQSGVAPESPKIGNCSISRYISMVSGMVFFLTYYACNMVPLIPKENTRDIILRRTTELREQLGKSHGFGTTMSVGVGRRPDGTTVILVSSNEGTYLRSSISLNNNEIFVVGTAHAEQNIVLYCNQNNIQLEAIGATRAICDSCVSIVFPNNTEIATPLKHPDRWYPVSSIEGR